MSEHRNGPSREEDLLDVTIRQALQRRSPAAQPPKEVWERIAHQVTAGPAPRRHRSRTVSLRQFLAPLTQGLVAAAILLMVGFSLTSNPLLQSYRFSTEAETTSVVVEETVVVAERVAPSMEPSPLTLPKARDDTLNAGMLIRRRQLSEHQLEVTIQAGNPRLDPALTDRSVVQARHSVPAAIQSAALPLDPVLDSVLANRRELVTYR